MSGVDTSTNAVIGGVNFLRLEARDYDEQKLPKTAQEIRRIADVLEALAAERDALTTERGAAAVAAEAARIEDLEEYVREYGMNIDDDMVDSCAISSVYRAMLDLAEVGRMAIEPGGVGRRIFGRWIAPTAPPTAAPR